MASFDELGRALHDDAAAHAPRASAIDVDAVTRAARARRRPRQWAVGTLSVVAVLGVGGLAVSTVTLPQMIAATESADLEAGLTDGGAAPMAEGDDARAESSELIDLLGCGALSMPSDGAGEGLALETRVPPGGAADGSAIAAAALLVNTSSTAIVVVTGATPVAVLTRNGVVVGVELPREDSAVEFELAPGESRELPMLISTLDCRDAGGAPLDPGEYGVTVVLDLLEGGTDTGVLVTAAAAGLRLD